MPNIREKLIEILRKTRHEYRRYIAMKDYEKRIAKTDEEFLAVDDSIVGEIPFCADHLITNGVTIPVRCKDCEHHIEAKAENVVYCQKFNRFMKADDFCSYGERKDNG